MKNIKSPTTKKPKKITESYLHNSGLYYLQRFASSSGHFRKVMSRKIERSCYAHPEQKYDECINMLDKLITKFQRTKLLNDDDYTRAKVISLRKKGCSSKAIKAKLMEKSVQANIIDQSLEYYNSEYGEDSEFTAALRLTKRKHLGAFEQEKGLEENKALAILARAGFSYDISTHALNIDKKEAESIIGALY